MPSKLPLPAPSRSLLRFLRSQSEGVSFFNPNHIHRSSCSSASTSRQSPRRPCLATRPPRIHARRMSAGLCTLNAGPVTATLEAALVDLEKLLPKSFFRKSRAKPSNVPSAASASFPLLAAPPSHQQQRFASHESDGSPPPDPSRHKTTWHERLWGMRRDRSDKLPPRSDPQEDVDFSTMFSTPRKFQLSKSAAEPRLRCTEVDEEGEAILVDGEFKKTELIAKYGLLPRDLRKIDSSNLPHILIRPAAILLNLLHLRVLIKADRVLLFDVYGSKTSYSQSTFMYDLQGKLRQKQPPGAGGLPYEFRALEAVLMSVTSVLETDFANVQEPVLHVLSELEKDITRDRLQALLVLSKKISTFEQRAKLVRDAIEELLEADDDLAAMYLTEKRHDLFRGEDDHTEVEMLLESYHKVCDEVAQEAGALVSSIRNTEEIIRAILDANRNSLMLLDLKFSVGTLGLAMGTFLAGLYGMNLENFIEETNWGFGAVTGISTIFSLIVCWYGLAKLRKVQRVKMMGGGGTGSNPNHRLGHCEPHWFGADEPAFMRDAKYKERLRRMNAVKSIAPPKKKWFGWRSLHSDSRVRFRD